MQIGIDVANGRKPVVSISTGAASERALKRTGRRLGRVLPRPHLKVVALQNDCDEPGSGTRSVAFARLPIGGLERCFG